MFNNQPIVTVPAPDELVINVSTIAYIFLDGNCRQGYPCCTHAVGMRFFDDVMTDEQRYNPHYQGAMTKETIKVIMNGLQLAQLQLACGMSLDRHLKYVLEELKRTEMPQQFPVVRLNKGQSKTTVWINWDKGNEVNRRRINRRIMESSIRTSQHNLKRSSKGGIGGTGLADTVLRNAAFIGQSQQADAIKKAMVEAVVRCGEFQCADPSLQFVVEDLANTLKSLLVIFQVPDGFVDPRVLIQYYGLYKSD